MDIYEKKKVLKSLTPKPQSHPIPILQMLNDGLSEDEIKQKVNLYSSEGHYIDKDEYSKYLNLVKQKKQEKSDINAIKDKEMASMISLKNISGVDKYLANELEKRGMGEKIDTLKKLEKGNSTLRQLPSALKDIFVDPVARGVMRPALEMKSGIEQLIPGGKTGFEPTYTPFGKMEPAKISPTQLKEDTGATAGTMLGEAFEVATAFLPAKTLLKPISPVLKTAKSIVNPVIKSIEKLGFKGVNSIDDLVGKVAQGKIKDIVPVKKALSIIDTTGIKTYNDLTGIVKDKIKNIAGVLDNVLMENKDLTKLDLFNKTFKNGDTEISVNYVKQAIDGLEDLYTKIGEPDNLVMIKEMSKKAVNEGLSIFDVNQLAKLYNIEMGSKAFSKRTGDALTGTNSKLYENIRKGVKETWRSLVGDKNTQKALIAMDEEMSNLYTLQRVGLEMEEKVNTLAQKVSERNVLQKIARFLGKSVDTLTGGAPREFLRAVLMESNVGKKSSNSLAIQEGLEKTLKQIDILLGKSPDDIIEKLSKLFMSYPDTVKQAIRGMVNIDGK